MSAFAVLPPSPPEPLPEDVDMSSGSSGNEAHETGSPNGDHSDKGLRTLAEAPGGPHSGEPSARAGTRRELLRTLRELKLQLPADRKAQGGAGTLATLQYALCSVRRVRASEEYYQPQLPGGSVLGAACVPTYTLGEMKQAASEQLLDNVDMFAAAVSLVSGRALFVSGQAASTLGCGPDALLETKFTELLAPHDVGHFHSCTAPFQLPPWSLHGVDGPLTRERAREKSFFCRVSVGKSQETGLHYLPFRMTPYLAKVRAAPGDGESPLCCLLLAERVHSGYAAPRIPPEKRIFTTTHTPNCLFQDVDERAVPLLGHLPQDLVATPLLLQLHPGDRPLMLALHRRVLRSGGQPFDYSPLRFRARNGEYVTLDTSWSSFVNPWSRKVAFIIGRHRVRTGPLNEDVFAAVPPEEEPGLQPSVQELAGQIHRLLLEPIPHSGSSGYGSLGSSGSQDQRTSQASSSDSNGLEDARRTPARAGPRRHRSRVKLPGRCSHNSGEEREAATATGEPSAHPAQPGSVPMADKAGSGASLPAPGPPARGLLSCCTPPPGSYQQISCLESVVRYLQSCSEAATLKRKCDFPARTPTPRASDKRKAPQGPLLHPAGTTVPPEPGCHPNAHTHLPPLSPPRKAESVVSLSNESSYSSTIVHVGDKKPQPEPELAEDVATGLESLDSPLGPGKPHSLSQDQEPLRTRTRGLTKEVLAAHTQKEEQSFLLKFKDSRKLRASQPPCHDLQERVRGPSRERAVPDACWTRKSSKTRRLQARRLKARGSSQSTGSRGPSPRQPPPLGLTASAWPPLGAVQTSCPAYSLPVFPVPAAPQAAFPLPMGADGTLQPWLPTLAVLWPGLPPPCAAPGQPDLPQQLPDSPRADSGPPCASIPCSQTWAAAPLSHASPPPCPSCHSSSPLQLNLLQLEDSMGSTRCPDGRPSPSREPPPPPHTPEEPAEGPHSDALSSSSDLLSLLLREGLCSPAGSGSGASATSESLGLLDGGDHSGSGSRTAESNGRRSEAPSPSITVTRGCCRPHGLAHPGPSLKPGSSSWENNHGAHGAAVGCALREPAWLLTAHADPRVLMTYQVPPRDMAEVLQADRKRLRRLQGSQPRFSEAQRLELQAVHPWVQAGGLPNAINVEGCAYCRSWKASLGPPDGDVPPLGLLEAADTQEGPCGASRSHQDHEQR